MKKFKLHKAFIIMVMIFSSNSIIAQTDSKNNVPATVLAAFTAKYPKAEVKNWATAGNEYTAKAKEGSNKFYATFDINSQWVKTTFQVRWSRGFPADIKSALSKSEYAGWRIDKLKKVETPAGDFYQVLVDNLYEQIDADHTAFAENFVLSFQSNGGLSGKESISSPLLF